MKHVLKLMVISAASSIAAVTAVAGSAYFVANTSNGSQSVGINGIVVPAGTFYSYRVFAFGGAATAYFNFGGAGVSVSDSASAGQVKGGSGTCPNAGQIWGSCTAQNGGSSQNSAEAGVSFGW